MSTIVFHEVTLALFLLVYMPSIFAFVQFAFLRARPRWKRDVRKERICLAIAISSLAMMIANLIALVALASI